MDFCSTSIPFPLSFFIHCGRTKSSTEWCTNNQSTWHRHVLCIQFRWMCINCKKKTNVLFETNKQKTTNNWKRKKKLTKTPQSAVRHQSPRYHQLFIPFFVCVYDSNIFSAHVLHLIYLAVVFQFVLVVCFSLYNWHIIGNFRIGLFNRIEFHKINKTKQIVRLHRMILEFENHGTKKMCTHRERIWEPKTVSVFPVNFVAFEVDRSIDCIRLTVPSWQINITFLLLIFW